MNFIFNRRGFLRSFLPLLGVKTQSQKQFTLTLPDGIPQPKFDMFQRVKVSPEYYPMHVNEVYTIVGICYLDSNTALKERLWSGWHYDLSLVHGLLPEELEGLDGGCNVIAEADLIA